MGFREPELRKAMAVMVNNCSTKGPRACFLKGKIEEGMVTALDAQSSAMLSSFARANCLIYVPVDVQEVQIGDQVEVHLLPE